MLIAIPDLDMIFCHHASQAVLDVTVISSLQPKVIQNTADKSGCAIEVAEHPKFRVHEENGFQQSITFVPLAVEVLSGMSSLFKKTLKQIDSL